MLILWLVVGLVLWSATGLLVAVVIGRGIRMADQHSSATVPDALVAHTAGADGRRQAADALVARSAHDARRAQRRPVGLTGIGAPLAAVAVLLLVGAYVAQLRDLSGTAGRLLSMDGPAALPRIYVTVLFATAAVAAAIGAGRSVQRRAWWAAVAAVATAIAVIKGGVVHGVLFGDLAGAITFRYAFLVSVLLAAAAVGGLWWLSRHERRDRTRVLGALALYAGASVVLSAGSSVVQGMAGPGPWLMTATFLEESLEGLSAVAFLMAVLVGVAPRLALPAEWALRRATDDSGLGAPALPRSAAGRRGEPAS